MQHAQHLALILFLALSAAVAAVVGSRHANSDARPAPPGKIAFALEDAHGTSIYVVEADDLQVREPLRLPDHARVIARRPSSGGLPQHIWNIAWSSDGRRLLYLVSRRTGAAVSAPWVIDLWGVDVDGSNQELMRGNFLPTDSSVGGIPLEALLQCNPEGRRCEPNPHPRRLDGSLSPGGKRVTYRGTGFDSSWICVTDTGAPRERDYPDGRCFGDGFFSIPAWSPF